MTHINETTKNRFLALINPYKILRFVGDDDQDGLHGTLYRNQVKAIWYTDNIDFLNRIHDNYCKFPYIGREYTGEG